MRAYSFSRINTYRKCPKMFYFQYVEKKPASHSATLEIGRLVHEFGQRYIKYCVRKKLDSDYDAIEPILNSLYANTSDSEVWQELLFMAENIAHGMLVHPDTQAEIKMAFDANWKQADWFDKKIRFRGIIDNLVIQDDLATITDYKTDRSLPAFAKLKDNEQLQDYAFLTSLLYPNIETFQVELFFVRFRKVHTLFYQKSELQDIRERLEAAMKTIDADTKYEPKPGVACDWCPFTGICNTYKKLLEAELPANITTPGIARQLAYKKNMMEAENRKLNAMLKSWVEVNGPVRIDGKTLDFHESAGIEVIDKKGVILALKNAGVNDADIWENLKVNKTFIADVLKSMGKTKEALARRKELFGYIEDQFCREEKTTSFRLKKEQK